MKTRFMQNTQGLTGKMDDKVFYYRRDLNQILARQYTPPCRNPSADQCKLIMANLKTLNLSAGYRQNFRDYLLKYNNLPVNREHPVPAWNNLWLKVMFGMVKVIPGIDLATLTRQQIIDQYLPCRSLKAAIDWELLPQVRGYEKYTALI
jgi:hypothetical protein